MSLKGRYVIDRIKGAISHKLKLPVPAYGSGAYWEKAYEQFGPNDCHEWGNVTFNDNLRHYAYKLLVEKQQQRYNIMTNVDIDPDAIRTTTFAESINIHPTEKNKPIMMLGCGNSKFGDEMLQSHDYLSATAVATQNEEQLTQNDNIDYGSSSSPSNLLLDLTAVNGAWQGPLYQVDVSSNVIETSTQRYRQTLSELAKENKYENSSDGDDEDETAESINNNSNNNDNNEDDKMKFIQDDATTLSAFEQNTMNAVIDKGLIDALFCADEYEQIQQVMTSVHRVLKPQEGIFVVFSFSSPEYLLPKLVSMMEEQNEQEQQRQRSHGLIDKWQNIQVREIDSLINMYRFQKSKEERKSTTSGSRRGQQPQQRGRKVFHGNNNKKNPRRFPSQ